MSYDLSLTDPVTKETLLLDEPHQMKGGTYVLGGTREAALNVTYNYSAIFGKVLGEGGIRTLYGMTGAASVDVLQAAIWELEDDVDDDYWKATEGNAKRALVQLLFLAKQRPSGVWAGD